MEKSFLLKAFLKLFNFTNYFYFFSFQHRNMDMSELQNCLNDITNTAGVQSDLKGEFNAHCNLVVIGIVAFVHQSHEQPVIPVVGKACLILFTCDSIEVWVWCDYKVWNDIKSFNWYMTCLQQKRFRCVAQLIRLTSSVDRIWWKDQSRKMFAASCSTLFICFALPWHGKQSINNDNVHCGCSYPMREKITAIWTPWARCLGEYEECVIIEFINLRFFSLVGR